MKKVFFLLTLLCLYAGTAFAQTPTAPAVSKAMTAETLRGLTTPTLISFQSIQTSRYGSGWFVGTSANNGHASSYTADAVFVWEPISGGTGYIKRYGVADDVAYMQTTNAYTFGAKATAQVFYPVTPIEGGTGNLQIGLDNKTESTELLAANYVRFVCGSADGTTWFNFNGVTYNSGTGIWTAAEVRDASEALFNYYSVYTLVNGRSSLMVNAAGTNLSTAHAESATFDANDTKFQFGLVSKYPGRYYMYSVSASKFVSKDGSLTDTPVDPVFMKSGSSANTFFLYFDASHHVNLSNEGDLVISNWSYADNGNSQSIQIAAPADLSEQLAAITDVQVNVSYKYGSTEVGTTTVIKKIGESVTAADLTKVPNYTTVGTVPSDPVTTDGMSMDVLVNENLPFVKSDAADLSNATWYVIDMHSNDSGDGEISGGSKNYIWTATTATDEAAITTDEVSLPKYAVKQSAAFGDEMLWCFAGDVARGFTIYNKAAGSAYALSKPDNGNTAAKLAPVASSTPFFLFPSTQITGAVCFKKAGDTHYVNTQKVGNVKVLRGWNQPDGGSSCRFYAPDAYMLRYSADIIAAPANALGASKHFNTPGVYEQYKQVLDALNSNHHNLANVATLSTLLTAYANDPVSTENNSADVTDGGYYRIYSKGFGQYLHVDGTKMQVTATDNVGATSVFQFNQTADGNYKLMLNGCPVGQTKKDNVVSNNATTVGEYAIACTGATFTLQDKTVTTDTDHAYMNVNSWYGVLGWEANDSNSKFFLVPATDIQVALNEVDGAYYGTLYVPFAVKVADSDAASKLYTGSVNAAKDGLVMSKQGTVPAGTGIVIASDNNTATLDITTATGTLASDLQGTYRTMTENLGDYLYLGKSNTDNKLGFYANGTGLTSVAANKAFLPKSLVSSHSLRMFFNDDVTGISGIETAGDSAAPVFDLSGRRVVRTVKGGVYISNGKKFIAR